MEQSLFNPTKTWRKMFGSRPKGCILPDCDCYCILDHFENNRSGFCVGLRPDSDDGLDIIVFCEYIWNGQSYNCNSRIWHPSEALLVASYLNHAVGHAIYAIKEYRQLLGQMKRHRNKEIKDNNNE